MILFSYQARTPLENNYTEEIVMTTFINYVGRKWTCDKHHAKIEDLISSGQVEKAEELVKILDPKKSRGICSECKRLYWETPSVSRY